MFCRRGESEYRGSPLFFLILSALAIALVSSPVGARPSYVHCVSSSECAEDECCVLGMTRYSTPQCMPVRAEGEECRRESQMTHNVTVGYPNGDTVDLVDVHFIICGCSHGLYCSKESSTCTKITRKPVKPVN